MEGLRGHRAAVFLVVAFAPLALAAGCAQSANGARSERALPRKSSIEQYGIRWTFDRPTPVGQFLNGDCYVVGPVTVTAVDPPPVRAADIPLDQLTGRERKMDAASRIRNGSMLNPPAWGKVSYDSRIRNAYRPDLITPFPVRMQPGDTLVSSVSYRQMGTARRMLNPSRRAVSPVRTAAVLTCLAAPVPEDAFRPCYANPDRKIYLGRDLRRHLLPSFSRVPSTPPVEEWERVFQRPWLDTVFFGFGAPEENMPDYGREIGEASGIAALLLCTDLPMESKEKLMVNFVQVGIDNWGLLRAGCPGWRAHGGHGSGRKLPIVFAGLLLGDEEMASPTNSIPGAEFSEDMQTMYDTCWTGAEVVYAGHVGRDGDGSWGPYEHLEPRDWLGLTGESYRRCCTSVCWVGQALAVHMLNARPQWNHDAFLDYCDRWMFEDDTEHVRIIKEQTGRDFSADYLRQGQTWYPFVDEMWAKHRKNLPAPTDGWKRPHRQRRHRFQPRAEEHNGQHVPRRRRGSRLPDGPAHRRDRLRQPGTLPKSESA